MSKKEENNSRIYIENNSAKNVFYVSHQKNKSFNFLSENPSSQIIVKVHSLNSNQNSRSKDKDKSNKSIQNVYNLKNLNMKNNIKESNTEPEKKEDGDKIIYQIKKNSKSKNSNINKIKEPSYSSTKLELEQNLKNIKNFREKLSKINERYSSNTPKHLSSIQKMAVDVEGDQDNLLVKKHVRLGTQRGKISPDNKDKILMIENKTNKLDNNN